MSNFRTITGGGVFSKANISDINANFTSLADVDVWVRPSYGNDNNLGTYDSAFSTVAGCARAFEPGLVVGIEGVLTEEYSTPIINDLTFIGARSNQPRQATTSSVPNGGGATWLSPSGGTGSLLTINGQSNKVQNIYFNNSATGATTGCIKLMGGGDPPLTADSGGTQICGCRFTGEANGIYIADGPGFLDIAFNTFMFFDSSGDCAILAGGSGGTGFGTVVRGNNFEANLTHLKALAFAYGWNVYDNHMSYVKGSVTAVVFVDFTGGNQNSVYRNVFDVDSGNGNIATMFVPGTTDAWAGNTLGSAVATTQFSWGDPA